MDGKKALKKLHLQLVDEKINITFNVNLSFHKSAWLSNSISISKKNVQKAPCNGKVRTNYTGVLGVFWIEWRVLLFS